MSFDLNLTTVCNHRIFRELSLLEKDNHTVKVNRPIASTVDFIVYADDNQVPQTMYSLMNDPEQIDIFRNKVIHFNSKWKSPTDYFEVTYYTLSGYCPKCADSKYLDDISYDVRGNLLSIRNEALLMQNVEKFTVTKLASNPFHTYVGTSLINLIGSRISNMSFLASQITAEINRTLQKFIALQGQYALTGRTMTDGEILQTVNNIQVTQDTTDPTVIRATVSVTAKSGKTGNFTQYLKIT